MDWGLTEPRVVAIYPGDNRVLSGYQIADELVVTAAHDVANSTSIRVSQVGDARRFDAELAWGGGSDHLGEIDAVVLRVPGLPAVSGRVAWVSHTGNRSVDCRMVGFPGVSASASADGAEPVAGAYLPGTGTDLGKLVLTVTSARPAIREGWRGLSGAAVRDTDDRIMGFVTQHDDSRHLDTLTVLPVSRLLAVPRIAELFGAPVPENVDADCHLVDSASRPLDAGTPSLSEFDLITARHQVVPYVKSAQDDDPLEELTAWCGDDASGQARVLARLLTGGAGSGKTRLSAELCQVVSGFGTGWATGFASSDRAALAGPLPKRPLLIVFDYTELNTDLARGFLQRIIKAEHDAKLVHPVRVLLVARSKGDWLSNLSVNPGIKTLLRQHPPVVLSVDDFDQAARRAHRDAAFERFTRPDLKPAPKVVRPAVDGDGYDTPLMVHIAALLAAKGEPLPGPDSDDLQTALLDNLIDREVNHLNDSLRDTASGVSRGDIRAALAIATLTTPTPDEAAELFTVDKRWGNQPPHVRQHVADMIRTRHDGPQVIGQDGEVREPIAAIEPDLISEHLTATLPGRTATITRLFTVQDLRPEHRARLLSLLALTGDHYPDVRESLNAHLASNLKHLTDDPTATTSLHGLLIDRLPQLLHAAVDQATSDQKAEAAAQLAAALDQYLQDPQIANAVATCTVKVPRPNGRLAHLMVAYRRHQANHYRRTGNLPRLARSLHNLGVHLSDIGRTAEGLAAAEEDVRIVRDLAEQKPSAYLPDLSTSLNNLANRMGEVGRLDEALAVAEESASIGRALAEGDSTAHLSVLALSLNTLGSRLGEVGRHDEALTVAEEAVGVYRRLERDSPQENLPHLALALNNLAVRLREVGRQDEALTAAEESVRLSYILVETNPTVYSPRLASSLITLSSQLGEMGGHDEALTAAEEAVETYRYLADNNPAVYVPALAFSLHNVSIRLSSLDRWDDTLAVVEEAVSIHRDLTRDNPATHLPSLARSLSMLAATMGTLERQDEALTASEEAVKIYRGLAEDNPAVHLPELANSLNTRAGQLGGLGRQDEALTASEEAVKIYRGLAEDNPAVHLPELAKSLSTLADQLDAVGRRGESLAIAEEGVNIRRGLIDENLATHLPDLAWSLKDLASRLGSAGRRAEALAMAERAVEAYHGLARTKPEAYRSDLAWSMNNLAIRLGEMGRGTEAVTTAEQAIEIFRDLAEQDPPTHLPHLALSLSNLAFGSGVAWRGGEDLVMAEEALTIYRGLALEDPVHLPELAQSLRHLGGRASEMGNPREAVAMSEESAAIYRELAKHDQVAYLPILANLLNELAVDLARVDRWDTMLAIAEEAVMVSRYLVERNRNAFLPDLAASLNAVAIGLSFAGRGGEAAAMAQESVTVYRSLAASNPVYRHDCAAAMQNLAVRLGEVGRWGEALSAARETVAAYRDLVEVNPAGYSPNLVMAMELLAAYLWSAGQKEESRMITREMTLIKSSLP